MAKKGGSSRVWKRRLLLLCVGVFVILLILARNQHANTYGAASPNSPASTPSATDTPKPKLGLAVQRAPVCLGDMGAQEYYVRVGVVNTGNVTEVMHFTVQPGYTIKPEWVKMGDVSLDPQKSEVAQGSLVLPTGVPPGPVDGQILVTASAPQVPTQVEAAAVTMRGRVGGGVPPC